MCGQVRFGTGGANFDGMEAQPPDVIADHLAFTRHPTSGWRLADIAVRMTIHPPRINALKAHTISH
jgi:hypothetical protein